MNPNVTTGDARSFLNFISQSEIDSLNQSKELSQKPDGDSQQTNKTNTSPQDGSRGSTFGLRPTIYSNETFDNTSSVSNNTPSDNKTGSRFNWSFGGSFLNIFFSSGVQAQQRRTEQKEEKDYIQNQVTSHCERNQFSFKLPSLKIDLSWLKNITSLFGAWNRTKEGKDAKPDLSEKALKSLVGGSIHSTQEELDQATAQLYQDSKGDARTSFAEVPLEDLMNYQNFYSK